MKLIKVYGEVSELIGPRHYLEVSTPLEAIHALRTLYPKFDKYLLDHWKMPFKLWVGGSAVNEETMHYGTSSQVIHFTPIISGAGKGGWGQIILGGALIIGSAGLGGILAEAFIGGTGAFAASATFAAGFQSLGWSMVLGGVSSMLFQPPKIQGNTDRPENKPSYVFDGPVNTAALGNCVPVAVGEVIVGSQVISAGLYTADIAV